MISKLPVRTWESLNNGNSIADRVHTVLSTPPKGLAPDAIRVPSTCAAPPLQTWKFQLRHEAVWWVY